MRDRIEAVTLDGPTVHVTARDPLPVEPRTLALAAAMRVFDRYRALTRLMLTVGEVRVSASRDEIERLLGPEGFAALKDQDRWRALLKDGLRAVAGEGTG